MQELSHFAVVHMLFHCTNFLCMLHTCVRKEANNMVPQQNPFQRCEIILQLYFLSRNHHGKVALQRLIFWNSFFFFQVLSVKIVALLKLIKVASSFSVHFTVKEIMGFFTIAKYEVACTVLKMGHFQLKSTI